MKHLAITATLLVICSFSTAHAATVCSTEMDGLYDEIGLAVYLGKKAPTSESGLYAKYDAADAKRGQYKFSDAIDKVYDISDKATDWANAPKAKLEDGTGINTAASAAIGCIGSL